MVTATHHRGAMKMNNASCFLKTENTMFNIGGEAWGLNVSFYVLYLGLHYVATLEMILVLIPSCEFLRLHAWQCL